MTKPIWFSNKVRFSITTRALLYLMIFLGTLRCWLGMKSFAMYNIDTYHDEWMMFRYSILPLHFATDTDPFALAKNMSFPLFLNLVHFSGLPYTLIVSLLWVLGACMSFSIVKRILAPHADYSVNIRSHDVAALLAYTFILFMPCAFDAQMGTKLYRNAIMAPVTLLFTLSLMSLFLTALFTDGAGRSRRMFLWGVGSGLLLSFNYYISENGVWLLLPTIVIVGCAALVILIRFARHRHSSSRLGINWLVPRLVACALPFTILFAWTIGYASVNYHYFGVFQINTRTGGEPGRFAQNIYKIASPSRSVQIWAPADAIDQAFAVSPTLQSVPDFHRTLVDQNAWANNNSLYVSPLMGDFLTWCLPTAMSQAGIWHNHQQVDQFLAQVNLELDQAFADGKLERDTRIQITASTGGYSWQEILDLRALVWAGFKTDIYFDGYAYAYRLGDLQSLDTITVDQRGLQANYMTNSFLEEGPYLGYYTAERISTDHMQIGIIKTYQIIGIPAFLIGLAGLILTSINMIKRRRTSIINDGDQNLTDTFLLISMLTLLLTTSLINVGIAWFSAFLRDPAGKNDAALMGYYAIASVPLVALFNILGATVVWKAATGRKHR